MNELKDELNAMHMHEWTWVPITANHHKWWLKMYRFGYDGRFYICFESPNKRRYSFRTARGENGGRVTDADVARANGETIASYWEPWGDSPARMDAVLRLTPKHILDRLSMLLDAIG